MRTAFSIGCQNLAFMGKRTTIKVNTEANGNRTTVIDEKKTSHKYDADALRGFLPKIKKLKEKKCFEKPLYGKSANGDEVALISLNDKSLYVENKSSGSCSATIFPTTYGKFIFDPRFKESLLRDLEKFKKVDAEILEIKNNSGVSEATGNVIREILDGANEIPKEN